jgi:hypothetical protein
MIFFVSTCEKIIVRDQFLIINALKKVLKTLKKLHEYDVSH